MTKPFRHGLVVGKFCPLHRGHELVINAAVAQCATVTVVSYTRPAFDRCGAHARERWLAERFPQVHALVLDEARLAPLAKTHGWVAGLPHNDDGDAAHRDFVGWLCHRVLDTSVDAVFTSEGYGDGFVEALTRYFRVHRDAGATRVRHVGVDPARRNAPVSGTAIRRDPHAHRDALAPEVYADFVKRICVLGGESSGKTTLAQHLARHLDTVCVPEFARRLWEERGGKLIYGDLLHIARTQLNHEQALSRRAHHFLICDTSPLTTLLYSHELFGRTEPELENLAAQPYDQVLLCAPDFPFVQDGTRRDDAFRQYQHEWYQHQLARRNQPFVLVTGSLKQRRDTALHALSNT